MSGIDGAIAQAGTVKPIIERGFLFEIHVEVPDQLFRSLVTEGSSVDIGLEIGAGVGISFKTSAVHLF